MKVHPTDLPGVLRIEPRVFADSRGSLVETWNATRYGTAGLPTNMVQDNLSTSRQGVLRGLHFQHPHPQGKLIYVLEGEIFDVAVDIRVGSPTFGRWVGMNLSAEAGGQLYIPEGFAHGFCVLSPRALVVYKCTDVYRPECETGIRWNDPDLGIRWPTGAPTLSPKDKACPRLCDLPHDRLPQYVDFQLPHWD